jgi:hypothetical protein
MAHIAHQPGPVCVEGDMSRWLAGVVVLGGGAAPAPPLAAWFASSIRVPKKNARCPGLPPLWRKGAWPGWLSYVPCSWGGQEEKGRSADQRISGGWCPHGARSRGQTRATRGANGRLPPQRAIGVPRALACCLCVETPVVAHRCFALPRPSILCGCINMSLAGKLTPVPV